MKKILTSLLIFTVSLFSLFAEGPLQQYQTFRWSKVERASKYGVEVETHNAAGLWDSVISETTTDTDCEVLLYPGNYRVSISTYNVLGKKASSTDWVEFTILDESEPYIFENTFTENPSFNKPVLNISFDGSNFSYGKENTIAAVEDYVENSFLLKGKNFFFPETKFYFKPSSHSVVGMSGEPFVKERKTIELSVIRRDREKDGIYLSYSQNDLFTGYYDFVIENPGNNSITKEILVITERTPEIETAALKLNKRYRAADVTIERSDLTVFSVTGFGFDSKTKFSLVPTDEGYVYPFASSLERSEVYLYSYTTKAYGTNGSITVDFEISSMDMQTGYYNFTATNSNGKSCTQKFLVTVTEPPETPAPVITSVSAKTKKGVSKFTIKGLNFSKEIKLTLIAPVAEENGTNKKIPLDIKDVKKDGKKIEAECSGLSSGYYAVLVETLTASSLTYFDISEKLAATVATLDTSSVDEIFMRPEEKEVVVEEFVMPEITYNADGSVNTWIALPSYPQEIAAETFAFCNSIGTLVVPEEVYRIGRQAFKGWNESQTILLNWDPSEGRTHYFDTEAFLGCKAVIRYKNGQIYENERANESYQDFVYSTNANIVEEEDADEWKDFFVVENGILRIKSDAAWKYNSSWRKVNDYNRVIIEKGVTYVCQEAFRNCVNIVDIEVASTVKEIESKAFAGCVNLRRITMPIFGSRETPCPLYNASERAFYGCYNLCEIKYIGYTPILEDFSQIAFASQTFDGKYIGGKGEKTNRLLFPNISIRASASDMGKTSEEGSSLMRFFGEAGVEVVNFRDYISLSLTASGPYSEDYIGSSDEEYYSRRMGFRAGGKITLGMPSDIFYIYSSVGIQLPVYSSSEGIINASTKSKGLPSKYYPFQLGFMLGGVFDVNYNLCLNQIEQGKAFENGAMFFTEYVSIGFRIPIGKKKYTNAASQYYLTCNSYFEKAKLEYNSQISKYVYEYDVTDELYVLPEKDSDVNIEWYAVSNKDISKLKFKLYDRSKKAKGELDLSPKGEYVVENIKAGVPFNVALHIPVTKKPRQNVTLDIYCESDDVSSAPSIRSMEKKY